MRLPPLFLLWSNLHGGVALGIMALAAACLEALVHDRKRVPRLALATAFSVVATACTPLGLRFFPDVLLSPARPDFRYITEWQPVGREPWTFAFVAFVAILAGLTVRFRSTLDERERLLAYVAVTLLPLALLVSRNIPIFTLAAGPLLSTLLLRFPGTRTLFRSGRPREKAYTGRLLTGCALALGIVAVAWQTRAHCTRLGSTLTGGCRRDPHMWLANLQPLRQRWSTDLVRARATGLHRRSPASLPCLLRRGALCSGGFRRLQTSVHAMGHPVCRAAATLEGRSGDRAGWLAYHLPRRRMGGGGAAAACYCSGAKYPPRLIAVTPGVLLRISTFRHFPSRVEFVDV